MRFSTVFILAFILGVQTLSAQSEKKAIDKFSLTFCNCLEKTQGNYQEAWEECLNKIISKHAYLLKDIGNSFKGQKSDFKKVIWDKINQKLSASCDKYNELITKRVISPNQDFKPIIKQIGNNICSQAEKLINISDSNINKIMLPLLEKEEAKLKQSFSSAKTVMNSLMEYLLLNCKSVRNYYSKNLPE